MDFGTAKEETQKNNMASDFQTAFKKLIENPINLFFFFSLSHFHFFLKNKFKFKISFS
jgi:hypothetical protein